MNFEAGNRVELLCGGIEFFPSLTAAIEGAREEVYLETYIYQDDDTGRLITDVLCTAARRGVKVHVSVDGFGSSNLAESIRTNFDEAGVEYVVFRPENYSWRSGIKWFDRKRLRRLHRKLAMVDRKIAFCGGINVLDDFNDPNHGPMESPRFDFAARLEGPIVGPISAYMLNQWLRLDWKRLASKQGDLEKAVQTWFSRREWAVARADGSNIRVAFVTRDNVRNRRSIERAYLAAIRIAKTEVILCNAYYFPGRRFRKRLIHAAQRGVRVRLLLQGMPEYPVQHYASQTLYAELLAAGIEIYEYKRSYLHAKVGIVDDGWATVGSSNIDPFSLLLAREANLVVRDEAFARELREHVEKAIENDSEPVQAERLLKTGLIGRMTNAISYVILRFAVSLTGITGQY
ncbi:MAG: cardiolipin synthase ClsB [Burkholderiaceae bacterium]